ncbi:thymidylate synthase [Streptomyces sp. HPF1205]|uniref:thymidylate synthase n=1 Tax=Streptomyces sp. HPF1205 TaxID=2873262 RepID=UPI001CEDB037|nr:thymidylate synthase [Streptomyces sp. HPF1205]
MEPLPNRPGQAQALAPVSFASFEAAYVELLRLATDAHQFRVSPRGNAANEVIGVAFRLTDPRQRLLYLAERKANPVFQWAEALWYLAGRTDLAMIGHYAPRLATSSRDGLTIDGSAYGHRIFAPAPGEETAAFDRVLELLRREPDSKRAFVPVFHPGDLAGIEANPDMPCLAGLHFLPRDGRLHMVCSMRANDLYRGLVSDVFSFTVIQEYAAVQLGLELGTYTHYMGSAHVNDVNADDVGRIMAEVAARPAPSAFPFPPMPATTGPDTIAQVLEHELALRTNQAAYSVDDIASLDLDPYWQQVLLLFEVHRQITHDQVGLVDAGVLAALEPGLRWLVGHRWAACAGPEGVR